MNERTHPGASFLVRREPPAGAAGIASVEPLRCFLGFEGFESSRSQEDNVSGGDGALPRGDIAQEPQLRNQEACVWLAHARLHQPQRSDRSIRFVRTNPSKATWKRLWVNCARSLSVPRACG